ncbi:MAG: ABC transporter ATP-binding protein [Clostridia bacterium]|nr:ABC transporter ATP-binding protein [Clostridia bacterium]
MDNKENKHQRPQVSGKTVKRLFKIIFKNYKKLIPIVIICIVISSIVSVSAPLFTEILIDDYIVPLMTIDNPTFDGLNTLILIMAGTFLLGVLTSFIYSRLMVNISEGTIKYIRDKMFIKMQDLPIKYFDTNTHGDIMSHYTNDVDTLARMISDSLPQLVSSLLSLIAVTISMFIQSWQLTLFILAFLVLMLKLTGYITKKSGGYFIGQQKTLGKVNGYIEEMINGQKVVKVFNYEERAKKNFDKVNEELYDNMVNANRFSNILMPILNNLGNLEYVLVALLGAYLAISGTAEGLTIGTIASFLALTRSFNQPIKNISSQVNMVVMAMAGATRIFELTDQEPEVNDGYVTLVNANVDSKGNITETNDYTGQWAWKHKHHDGTIDYIELKGYIEIENVNFGYEPNKEILHDITLYAKPGQKIAFVGATGAGKTTITNLINRFYDVEDGKIRYDGININKIKKEDLRKSLGLVLQDTNLFTGTIKENIKYGKLDATDEEVIKAAKIANAHDFISMLPKGYDTMLTANGSQLSQGQRQLLSIARCAINNPPVMILDEATSSIDTRTEKLVQDGMDKLMEGRTVFVIAHRLSTVRNSKAIMVMENGKIIERGTHEQLLEQKGQYYQLYTGAFELE